METHQLAKLIYLFEGNHQSLKLYLRDYTLKRQEIQNEKASSNNQDYQKALKMLKMSPRSYIRMQ